MRSIGVEVIIKTVADLFIDANYHLTPDVLAALQSVAKTEESSIGKSILQNLVKNAEIASLGQVPLCQDCGSAVVFLEIGQDVHIVGGDLYKAVNQGVKIAYDEGYLRKSILVQPFSERVNTQDNTPAIIYVDIVPGDKVKIIAVPKGGGAENMSRLGMLTPADGREGVINFVLKTVEEAGSNPCPPLIVGVGIGGTAEKALLLAKKSLIRKLGDHNPDNEVAELENELLIKINQLGIGPMGYGGKTTALAVNVDVWPAHLASLPVGVNLNCHCSRHKEAII
jgi:fumarate hydratase subunit alpha